MSSHSLAFVICTERPFEQKSVLLARSLRRFGGVLSQAPIYSFSPRRYHRPSADARRQLERAGVHHSECVLNHRFAHLGLANKPFVCAHAESAMNAEVLVFLDSDTVFLNPPAELQLDERQVAAAGPVYLNLIGSTGADDDPNEEYWRELYRVCQVDRERFVTTVADRVSIREYFNSGLIAVRRDRGIFARWLQNFVAVMEGSVRPTRPYYVEQSVFSATVTAMVADVRLLPVTYNYPVTLERRLRPIRPSTSLDDVVSIHYHKSFDGGQWQNLFDKLGLDHRSEPCLWLQEQLRELDI